MKIKLFDEFFPIQKKYNLIGKRLWYICITVIKLCFVSHLSLLYVSTSLSMIRNFTSTVPSFAMTCHMILFHNTPGERLSRVSPYFFFSCLSLFNPRSALTLDQFSVYFLVLQSKLDRRQGRRLTWVECAYNFRLADYAVWGPHSSLGN